MITPEISEVAVKLLAVLDEFELEELIQIKPQLIDQTSKIGAFLTNTFIDAVISWKQEKEGTR